MAKVDINADTLKNNVETSLNEIKKDLKSIAESAKRINTSGSLIGSDKIANIPSKIQECIDKIDGTIEWYGNCSYNYNQFSSETSSDIASMEIPEIKSKDFKIKE